MHDFVFTEATREKLKLKMALTGVTGGGKTYTGLALATFLIGGDLKQPDMAKRIAVIDSERGSSRRYAKSRPFNFSVLELKSFEPEAYVAAIHAAERGGFEVLVIDSLSHEWIGTGGALDQVDKNAKGGNTFVAWGKVTPRHNAVIDAIMGSSLHIIATMRAKMAHEQTVEDGKKVVKKLGLAAQQRDGIEYEFDIVGDMDLDNVLTITKTRCLEINGKSYRQPGRTVAAEIAAWLDDGVASTQIRSLEEALSAAIAEGAEAAAERSPERYKAARATLIAWCESKGVDSARIEAALAQFKARVTAATGPAAPPVANDAAQLRAIDAGAA